MKKLVLFLLLFSVTIVSAAPVLEFQHEDILDEETIFATLTTTGTFEKQLTSSDITFYEGRRSVYFERDIMNYNGTYYLYIYANRPGEFKMQINDILFKEDNGILQSITIEKEFNITSNSNTDPSTNETISKSLSIKPGFVYYPKDTSIKLWNKGNSDLEITYGKEKITISAMSVKEIEVLPEEKISFITIKSYKNFEIPVFYPTLEDEFISPSEDSNLRTEQETLTSEIYTNTKTIENIKLLNLGLESLTDIKVTSEIEGIKFGNLNDMGPKETQNLTLTFDLEEAGYIIEDIEVSFKINGETKTTTFSLSLFVLPKGTSEENFEMINNSCDNLGGVVCTTGTICDGDQRFTSEAKYCCFGNCTAVTIEEKSNKTIGRIIAVIILLGIAGYAYYAYKKQKKLKTKSPKDKLEESTKKFESRMKPKPTSRVKGSLTKS